MSSPNRPPPEADMLAGKQNLSVFSRSPANAEPAVSALGAAVTPFESVFLRNRGLMPADLPADRDTWRLDIDGFVERPLVLTLRALKTRFEPVTETVVLECAGNNRTGVQPSVHGEPWSGGAVACLRWTGARLGDVLRDAGVRPEAVYTAHHSPDLQPDGAGPALSRGLPIGKALSPETLLAYGLNGEPLPAVHGGPLRVVAPGFPGAAWQKWVNRITVRDREHDGPGMTGLDYRLPDRPLRPGDPTDGVAFHVIEDVPVKSNITAPTEGASHRVGTPLRIQGHAWSGHTPVAALDLSLDCGLTWTAVPIGASDGPFAWRAFDTTVVPQTPGILAIMTRATDAQGRRQPLEAPWNPNGYCNNACPAVMINVED